MLLAACGQSTARITSSPPPVTEPVTEPATGITGPLVAADTGLAADLYTRLATGPGNMVLSPASIATVLQMALPGAGGATAGQMRQVLHLGDTTDAQLIADVAALRRALGGLTSPSTTGELLTSDRVWLDQHLVVAPDFAAGLQAGWQAPVGRVDFAGHPDSARGQINAAVAAETDGQITNLLAPHTITSSTRFVLTDAVYLKGDWSQPFSPSATSPGPFTPSGASPESLPQMHETAPLAYARGQGYQAVQMPYVGGRLAMTILLPDGSVGPLEQRLAAGGLSPLLGGQRPTDVALPQPTFQVPRPAALGAGRHRHGRRCEHLVDRGAHQHASGQARGQAAHHGLDFGEFRHGAA